MTPRPVGRLARRYLRPIMVTAGAAALLVGCAKDAPQDTWQPAGDNARKIDDLQRPVFAIAGVVGLAVFLVVIYIVLKFRDKGQPVPEQTHGNPRLEIALTILPAVILVGVAVPTFRTIFDLAKTNDAECVVTVTGQQWWWEFQYDAQEGCGGIPQTIVTSGQLVMPAHTKVQLKVTSRDVIHSFWIPKLNGKKDAVPGRIQPLRLQSDRPGIYAGQCTEFCGLSHANMRQEAVVLEPADFQTWVANQTKGYAGPLAGSQAAEGESQFINQCARCHTVNGLLDPTSGAPVISKSDENVYSGVAPNLSFLMTRNTFAGASFDLLTAECRDRVWNARPDEFGALYLQGVTPECLNQVDLREWLRNAPAKKPMYADENKLAETDGKFRGMPNLNLTEDQIDQIVAYLLERT